MTVISSYLRHMFAVALLFCLCSFSYASIGNPEKILFSPDSFKIAFMWSENFYKFALIPIDTPLLKKEIYVYLCNTTKHQKRRSFKVDTLEQGNLYDALDIRFSPDSRYLAVFTSSHLSIVDSETNKLWRLAEGQGVTSFQWLGNSQIGYCVFQSAQDDSSHFERVFWEQNITNKSEKRSLIYKESPVKYKEYHGVLHESWSPQGKYVIFLTNSHQRDSLFNLLNISEGKVLLTFGKPESFSAMRNLQGDGVGINWEGNGISWKGDDTGVFCVAGIVGKSENAQAYLIDTENSQILDCSKNFLETFGADISPCVIGEWTPDGNFIPVTDYLGLGSCLIQPVPWKVIRLQEKLALHLKLDEKYKPALFPVPMLGWIGINAIGVDEKYAADESTKYAIDYSGQKLLKLFDTKGWWDCSPDGRYAAVIGWNKNLTVHKLDTSKFIIPTANTPRRKDLFIRRSTKPRRE